MTSAEARTSEMRARERAKYLSGLLWHVGAFIIINAFLWILDTGLGDGTLDGAYWITLFWGFALAFHALAYFVAGRQVEERKTQEYLEDERRRQALRG